MNDTNKNYLTKEGVLKKIAGKRAAFDKKLEFKSRHRQFAWEMFLILEYIAKISYATSGQMRRYIQARKKHFEPDLKIQNDYIKRLAQLGFIQKTNSPIVFTKGKLKGEKLTPYFLTKKGSNFLSLFEAEAAELARFGEPSGKNFERLQHEILISEVYVHLFEAGYYVIWIISEANMRREICKKKWRGWSGRDTSKSIGDFRIAFFNSETSHIEFREGEIAVKYTRNQILTKPDGLWWFCYDQREAGKIHLLKNETPTILTNELLKEARNGCRETKRKYNERKHKTEKIQILQEYIESIGGLTTENAAKIVGLSTRRVRKKLKELPGISTARDSIQPGQTLGSGRVIYLHQSVFSQPEKQREVFVLNLLVEYLLKNDYKFAGYKGKPVMKKESEQLYQLIVDGTFMRKDDWQGTAIEVENKIQEGKMNGLETILGVSDRHNLLKYRRDFAQIETIDLNLHF